jgi:hypothetical protein
MLIPYLRPSFSRDMVSRPPSNFHKLSDVCSHLETSTNALSFSLALLAVYADKQQKVYEEALSLWPEGQEWPEDDLKVCFVTCGPSPCKSLKHTFSHLKMIFRS